MFDGSGFDKVLYRMPTMFERSHDDAAMAERTIPPQAPVRDVVPKATVRLSRAERLKMTYAAASMGVAKCPAWILLALDRNETMKLSGEDGSGSC
jgi:hypothetical protein